MLTSISPDDPPDEYVPGDWRHRAKCRDVDPELFFPHPGETQLLAEARAVCADCPVIIQCREWALDTGQVFGVWGGVSAHELRLMRAARRRIRQGRAA
ncbi:MAG: WhiB family transcriptional regulator [Pseudonocardiaceae bacterium]